MIDNREINGPALFDRAGIEELVRSPSRCSLERIEAAIARADYDDAVARVLARLKPGDGQSSPTIADRDEARAGLASIAASTKSPR